MKTINVVFAVHNHQPIGNFETVFEEAYQRSYRPFLEVLERHPTIRFTQHWTGPLLEWLVRTHPECIEKMGAMVHRGQLELLTGAYYEAILAVIPEEDRIGQVRKMTEFVKSLFGYEPRGMWLAERVWEPHLARSLSRAGVEFVVLDDTHFKHAGLGDDLLLGHYTTEEMGERLKVLPIDKTLRYTVPFRQLGETTAYLQNVAEEHGRGLVVHADDGEKFGVWPKTHQLVYGERWLENFCRMLEENVRWITTLHMNQAVRQLPSLGRIYLPTGSYAEMMKWALHPAAFLRVEEFEHRLGDLRLLDSNSMFISAGFWRNFFAKYPEANHMHKKMLRVAHRARDLEKRNGTLNQSIFDHIWAGQCNDPYWHGVFGGLYLPNLRFPVYRNLLQAEAKMDAIEDLPDIRVEETDFDCDGNDELLIESDELNLYFTPAFGGSLVELDYKPASFNLLDILSRREEGYHRRLVSTSEEHRRHITTHGAIESKEGGLENYLHADWYRRGSLIDHFPAAGTTLQNFAACRYHELGDFVNQPYRCTASVTEDEAQITLARDGALWFGSHPHRITVKKVIRYTAGRGIVTVDYSIQNREKRPASVLFGVEWNVGLMAGDAHDRYFVIDGRALANNRLGIPGEEKGVASVRLVDEWLKIETGFAFDRPAGLWRFPVETVSLSEAGFERLYQSSVVFPHWEFTLEEEFTVRMSQSVKMRTD